MPYDVNAMPRNQAEWEELVAYYMEKDDLPRAEIEARFDCYRIKEQPSEPEPTLAELKAMKLAELESAFKQACKRAVTTVNGLTINANERAYANVDGLIKELAATNSEGPKSFCLADNSFAEVDRAALEAFQLAIIYKGHALYDRKWQLRSAINAAQDEAGLAAIAIEFV